MRRGESLTGRTALLGALGCLAGLALTGAVALLVPAAHAHDAQALHSFTELATPRAAVWLNRIAHLVDPAPYALAGVAMVATAVVRGRPRLGLAVVAILLAAAGSAEVLKPLLGQHGFSGLVGSTRIPAGSWPSGHSTAAMALTLCAIAVSPSRLRTPLAVAGAAFSVAVSLSLLTLDWHLPSDVVGGYLLAGFWTLLALAVVRAAEGRWAPRAGREALSAAAAAAGGRVGLLAAGGAVGSLAILGTLAGHLPFALDHRSLTIAAAAIVAVAAGLSAGTAALLRR